MMQEEEPISYVKSENLQAFIASTIVIGFSSGSQQEKGIDHFYHWFNS